MRIRMKNIVYLMMVVALLAFALVGCTNKTATPTDPVSTESVNDSESSDTEAEAPKEVTELKLYVDVTWWPYKTWEGRIPELATEITGVKPIVTVAADYTALDLMIASGDLGDMVLSEQFTRLSDSNVCYDIDTIASENNIDLSGIHSVMRFVNTATDGKVYSQFCGFSPATIMDQYDALVEGRGLVARTDIMEELGVKESDINNLTDFENLLAQVKTNYPDMIPYVYNTTHDNDMMKMLCGATMDSTGFVDVDDQLYVFLADPNMKTYYMLMNKWYRLGYMTDENFAWSTDTSDYEYMAAGKVFAVASYDSTAANWNKIKFPESGVDFTVTQFINIYNQPGAQALQRVPGWRGLFIAKSCSDPAAALNFCTWAWSQEGQNLLLWGEEGVDWNWSEDKTYPVLNYDFQNPNQDDGMKYWGWTDHDGFHNTNVEKGTDTPTLHAMEGISKIARFNPVLGMIRINPDSEQNTIMTNLEQLEKVSKSKIITAKTEAEAEAAYNEMIETANQMGMQELLDWANQIYVQKAAEYEAIKDSDK